jgi:spermidine/putrescine-binding protein
MKMPTCTGAMLILAMAAVGGVPRFAAAEEPRLNVYNWSDYIAPTRSRNSKQKPGSR